MIKKAIAACVILGLIAQFGGLTNTASAAKRYAVVQEDAERSFVPIRFTAENFGFKVEWKGKEQKVLVSNAKGNLVFTLGSKEVLVNGEQQLLDVVPFVLSETVYIPLRFAATSLGVDVEWKKGGKIALKNGKKQIEVDTVSLARVQEAVESPVVTGNTTIETSTKKIAVNTVSVDLYHPKITLNTVYANNKVGSTESFKDMIKRSKASVAVNGTFFNAYSTTNVKVPYGYIVQSGKVIHKASQDQRSVFVYTKTGDVLIVDGETELKKLLEQDVVEAAVQAGPRLVRNGKVDTNPAAEGFKDPKVLTNSAGRTAIGVTADGKLIIITVSSATIKELAEVMVKLGATAAMNLDGGASSGLYANSKYITTPGRDLSNALIAVFSS